AGGGAGATDDQKRLWPVLEAYVVGDALLMRIIDTQIADVKLIEPTVFGDARGFFFESFNEKKFAEATGV
ncbi:dTDP-4-dehydrorhamnose 3,5-epimerase family protein, partial [Cereibacter sphaeroides]|uniref:dTDP-4-dehydrorhamnose 3,5-epimerase family protein n=1 Tax=Cereibacter sphaeroides TaxID=1063 RepID=UPI001F3A7508